METPKEYHYTYYSYEEWGRGYFGSRGCKCLPEEDIKYLGSSKDKTFKPKYKIILKDDYSTREEAYADEIILQQYYKVVENPHFANRAYQTSTKFCYSPVLSSEEASRRGKIGGAKGGKIGGKLGGKKSAEFHKKNKSLFWDTEFQSEMGRRRCKQLNSEKWKCTETGFVTSSGNLTQYQRARNIDTSKRIRIS